MKYSNNNQIRLALLLIFILTCSLSLVTCQVESWELIELKQLEKQRKNSTLEIQNEYRDIKQKFDLKHKEEEVTMVRQEMFYRVYIQLSQNIKKIMQSYSDKMNQGGAKKKWPRFEENTLEQDNYENPSNFPTEQASYLRTKEKENAKQVNLESTYEKYLKNWAEKIDSIKAKLYSTEPESKYYDFLLKLDTLHNNTNYELYTQVVDNHGSLNYPKTDFDENMKDIISDLKDYYYKVNYILKLPNFDNRIMLSERKKMLNNRKKFWSLTNELVSHDSYCKSSFQIKYDKKFNNDQLAENFYTQAFEFLKKVKKYDSLLYSKNYIDNNNYQVIYATRKTRLVQIMKLFSKFSNVTYDKNDSYHQKLAEIYEVPNKYQLLCENIIEFLNKLEFLSKENQIKDTNLILLGENLKHFPFGINFEINKKNITDSQENLNEFAILKNIENLKIITEYVYNTEPLYDVRLYYLNGTKCDVISKLKKMNDLIKSEKIDFNLDDHNPAIGNANWETEMNSQLYVIFSNFTKGINDSISYVEKQIKEYNGSTKFYEQIKKINLIQLLYSDFYFRDEEEKYEKNFEFLDSYDLNQLLETLNTDINKIKRKINVLKSIAKKESQKLKSSTKIQIETLHNLKLMLERPFLNENIQITRSSLFKQNSEDQIKELFQDIDSKLNGPRGLFKTKSEPKKIDKRITEKFKWTWTNFQGKIKKHISDLVLETNQLNTITTDYEKLLKNENELDEDLLKPYINFEKSRKANGVKDFINFLRNFFNTKKSIKILSALYEKLNPEKVVSRTSTNEQNSQFTRVRLWMSYRFEEALEKFNQTDKNLTVIDLLKISTVAYMTNMKPAVCWKETVEERLNKRKSRIDEQHIKIGPLIIKNCNDDLYSEKDFCREKCEKNELDCGSYCSKYKKCEVLNNFRLKTFKKVEKYNSGISIGFQNCNSYGYVNCDERRCAISKEFCEIKTPELSKRFVDAYANFVGYIQSFKEGEYFGWTDKPEKFKSTIDELENFYFSNKELIDLYENFVLKDRKDTKSAFKTFKEILIFLGFYFDKDDTIQMKNNNIINGNQMNNFISRFYDSDLDYETFLNLRKKESFGRFINEDINETTLQDINFHYSYRSNYSSDAGRTVESYLKLTKRILNLMLIFQKPKCEM